MATAGGTRLLRPATAALGGAAHGRLLFAGAGSLPDGRGPGRSAKRGLGGRVGVHQALSTSAQTHRSSEDKINRDDVTLTAKGKVGDSLLDVVVENNLGIDGFGACEGTLACSTCHLIFEDHIFEKLEAVTDEENDMLDLAYGLTDRSRLGCQICLTKSVDNMTV
ncbi:adrenodoxin-like [Manis javanica]|uniref:adrenodoxin-like n=1 Tax=Manis javanica TaxID=9974 RepID=UPI003C6CF5F6